MKTKIAFLTCSLFVLSNVSARSNNYIPLETSASSVETRNYSTNELIKAYMDLTAFRHKVLSENIANLNTPDYESMDVEAPKTYSDLAGKGAVKRGLPLVRTSSSHIACNQERSGKFASHKITDPYEVKPNGNNVSLAQQMTKVSQNQNDYNAALKNYSAINSLVEAALGK